MNRLDKILHVVAPAIKYDSVGQGSKEQHTLLKTADELMNDFANDENDANCRYNDKLIRVSGVIKSIQHSHSIQIIFLTTSSALCSIICHFTENYQGQLNLLRPWQSIVVKGVCAGILKHVVLEKCELEES